MRHCVFIGSSAMGEKWVLLIASGLRHWHHEDSPETRLATPQLECFRVLCTDFFVVLSIQWFTVVCGLVYSNTGELRHVVPGRPGKGGPVYTTGRNRSTVRPPLLPSSISDRGESPVAENSMSVYNITYGHSRCTLATGRNTATVSTASRRGVLAELTIHVRG